MFTKFTAVEFQKQETRNYTGCFFFSELTMTTLRQHDYPFTTVPELESLFSEKYENLLTILLHLSVVVDL